jgi:drug/metabolite transporter (DMT)-like permease
MLFLVQVLGHAPTVLVLLISWLALGESMSARKAAGMAVAVSGMIAYAYCVSASSSSSSSSSASRKTSKPGTSGSATSGTSGDSGAMELLKGGGSSRGAMNAAAAAGGDVEEGQELLPLL